MKHSTLSIPHQRRLSAVLVCCCVALLVLAIVPPAQAADVNGDGQIDREDIHLIRGQLYPNEPDGRCPTCDTNGDGRITMRDMLLVMNRIHAQAEPAPTGFQLQILHFADMDGTSGALDNVDRFSAVLDGLRAQYPNNTVVLTSGDNYIPGPRYFAASDERLTPVIGASGNGRSDIAFLNAMGVHASTVGNHDLDEGPAGFANAIRADGNYPGARFPFVSSNIDFSADENLSDLVGVDGEAVADIPGQLVASAVIPVGDEVIGLVGAAYPELRAITQIGNLVITPDDKSDIAGLAATIQSEVDQLRARDVNKIILLAHMQQIAIEKALATELDGVDVIVAGGSNTLLADSNDALLPGNTAADDYPLRFDSASGEPILVVNTDGDYKYVGRLVLRFDESGVVIPSSLSPAINGAWAATDANAQLLGATPIEAVSTIAGALKDVLAERDGNILGNTAVYLEGRRNAVRTEETNLGNLTADANLWMAQQLDPTTIISLKNGGGIRDDIGLVYQPPGSTDPSEIQYLPPAANPTAGKDVGDISQFDLQGTLRFNNALTLLTVTAAELADIIEHAVAGTAEGATPGQFPQVGGLRFSFDPSMPAREAGDTNRADVNISGDRLRNLAVVDANGAVIDAVVRDGMVLGDPTRPFRLVTLNFIAKCVAGGNNPAPEPDCGDAYPLNGLSNPQRVDLAGNPTDFDPDQADFAESGSEQDALAEYLRAFHAEQPYALGETPVNIDRRIQNLSARNDAVFPELVILNLADTHSAYDAFPRLLTLASEVHQRHSTADLVTLFNGDLFELGNAAANKSAGVADWAFLNALRTLGPVVVNLGNHEFDFMTPAEFVSTAQANDIKVIGTVADQASGQPLAPTTTDLSVSDKTLRVVGIATNQMNTYPAAIRDALSIPDPAQWASDHLADTIGNADHAIVLSHAGVTADKAILDVVPNNTLFVVGGHDHLLLQELVNGTPYRHHGFRGEWLNVTELYLSEDTPWVVFSDHQVNETIEPEPNLTTLIDSIREEYLEADDLAIIGTVPTDMTVLEGAMWSVTTLRDAVGADVAMLNHTSFGSDLKAGPLPKYRFDQFMRFDNDVMQATVDAETLRTILARSNQHLFDNVADRTGDFLYTSEIEVAEGNDYIIVTSSWVALDFNQPQYLGTNVIFEPIEGVTTKSILTEALQ